MSFHLSARSSVRLERLGCHWVDILETWYLSIFENISKNTKFINLLKPNGPYTGRTGPLTSKGYILYIYSTNIGIEYFKHGTYCSFYFLQNAVCFIILKYLVPVLFTFYIQGVLNLKKIPAPNGYYSCKNNEYFIIRLMYIHDVLLNSSLSDKRFRYIFQFT